MVAGEIGEGVRSGLVGADGSRDTPGSVVALRPGGLVLAQMEFCGSCVQDPLTVLRVADQQLTVRAVEVGGLDAVRGRGGGGAPVVVPGVGVGPRGPGR